MIYVVKYKFLYDARYELQCFSTEEKANEYVSFNSNKWEDWEIIESSLDCEFWQ